MIAHGTGSTRVGQTIVLRGLSLLLVGKTYHTNFSPPCNWRPTVCELASLPKPELPTVSAALVGLDRLKVGVFVKLKDSARNSTRLFSPKRKSLKIEKSRFRWPGPRRTMRAALPNVGIGTPLKFGTVAGALNAAGLKYWSKPALGTSIGCPDTRSGRLMVPNTGGKAAVVTSVARPERTIRMPLVCHPPMTWFKKRLRIFSAFPLPMG